jgi:hypothetical protein
MKIQAIQIAAAIAILLGVVQCFFATYCWSHIAIHSPLIAWLMNLGLRGQGIRVAVWSIDFVINIVLSIPIAFALVKLRPRKLGLYLVLAVASAFIWSNMGLVGNPYFAQFAGTFVLAWIPELLALPIAAWLVSFALNRGTPDHSLKAKSILGSA